jgi:hypothetical protein
MLYGHFPRPHRQEIDSQFMLCRVPCLMTATASEHQPLCGQKRRRGEIEEERSTNGTPQPARKRTRRRRQSQQETNTAYWDSLSKLWLTRRALDELNRRSGKKASPVRPGTIRRLDLGYEADLLKNPPKQLKRFARHGGPDLRDLRGVSLALKMSKSLLISSFQYPEPPTPNSTTHIMPSNQSSSRTQSKSRNTLGDSTVKTTTSRTKKTSPYDPNFGQYLIDNGVYPDDYDFPDGRDPLRPNNENEILDKLGQSRASLSPSQFPEKAFRSFKQKNSRALNEDAVMGDVFPIIQGTASIPSAKNLVFGNLEPLPHGNLVDAKPDFYNGAHPAQIHLRIREELGSYITPATQVQAPALPNFFTEAKGPDGSAAVARRQACFDGALGARGIHQLQSFEADPTLAYDNKAYTITSTYNDGQLNLYTVHPTQSPDPNDSPKYHMTQLRSFAMTDAAERFREGARAFRNARDWAKAQRDELIAVANGRVTGTPGETSTLEPSTYSISQSTIDADSPESETSADELSQDVGPASSLSRKRLKREPEKRSSNPDLKTRMKKSYSGANSRSRSRGRLSQS